MLRACVRVRLGAFEGVCAETVGDFAGFVSLDASFEGALEGEEAEEDEGEEELLLLSPLTPLASCFAMESGVRI